MRLDGEKHIFSESEYGCYRGTVTLPSVLSGLPHTPTGLHVVELLQRQGVCYYLRWYTK